MRILQPASGASARHIFQRGFTLVELMIASGVGVLVLGATMVLLIQSAKENRRSIADASVEQAASDLENRIVFYLKGMSASEGVTFFGTATNASGTFLGYTSIIVARGPAPDFPREQISFDASQGSVTYNPNRSGLNPPNVLIRTNAHQSLRLLCFSPSLKADGTVDNALVNLILKMDDNGSAGRIGLNPASICRSVAVRMRNN